MIQVNLDKIRSVFEGMRSRLIFFFMLFISVATLSAQSTSIQPTIEILANKQYGFEPFSTEHEYILQSMDKKIEFASYILVVRDKGTRAKSEMRNWLKEPKIYKQNSTEGRAVINVAFWGVIPKSGNVTTFASPSQPDSYKMSALFADAVGQSASTLINTDNLREITLLIVPIPKDSYLNASLKKEINTVHSETLYILWNKSIIPEKPDFLIDFNGKVEEYQLRLPEVSKSTFIINGPEKIKISYSFIGDQVSALSKPSLTNSIVSYDASNIQQVVFTKPKNFNLVAKGDADSTEFLIDKLTIDAVSGYNDIINMVPVGYQCLYIDASQLKSKSRVSRLIDSVSSIPGGFMVYLSRKGQPIVARNKTEIASLESDLYNFTFQSPIVVDDLKKLSAYTNLESFSKRVGINYHLILSNDIYSNEFKSIKNNLLKQCNCEDATFTVYLTIPADELTEKLNGVKYVFLN